MLCIFIMFVVFLSFPSFPSLWNCLFSEFRQAEFSVIVFLNIEIDTFFLGNGFVPHVEGHKEF